MKKIILTILLFSLIGCSKTAQPNLGTESTTKKILKSETIKGDECIEYTTPTTTIVCKKFKDKQKNYYIDDETYPAQKYNGLDEIIEKRKYEEGVGNMQFYKKNDKETIVKITLGEKIFHNDNGVWKKVKIEKVEKETSLLDSFILGVNADDTTESPDKDGQIYSSSATLNYGSAIEASARYKPTAIITRFLLGFTMPSSLGTLTKVDLSVYPRSVVSASTVQIDLHELSRNDWVESQFSWNYYKTGGSWTTSGGDYSATIVDSDSSHTVGTRDVYTLYGTGATNPMSITWGDSVDVILKISSESGATTVQVKHATREITIPEQLPYIEITYSGDEPTDTCTYSGTGDWVVLESDNCYITENVYVNGVFKLIGSSGGKFGCSDNIKVSAENFQFGTDKTTFDIDCFAHH